MSPGASFAAVCPPDFTTPTSVNVSSGRLSQWRTSIRDLHVSALDRELHLLDVLVPSTAFALDRRAWIGGLDRLLAEHEPLVISSSGAAHGAHEGDGRDNERGHQGVDLRLHRRSFQDRIVRLPPAAISGQRRGERVWVNQYVPTSAQIKVDEEFPAAPTPSAVEDETWPRRVWGSNPSHQSTSRPADQGDVFAQRVRLAGIAGRRAHATAACSIRSR